MARIDWSIDAEDIIKRVKEIYGASITEDQVVKALGYEYRISWKKAVEVARFIRGFTIKQAEEYLNNVIKMRTPIPIRRFTKKQAHHTTPWEAGRWLSGLLRLLRLTLRFLRTLRITQAIGGVSMLTMWLLFTQLFIRVVRLGITCQEPLAGRHPGSRTP